MDLINDTKGWWHLDVAQYAQAVEEEILQTPPQVLEDEEAARKPAKKKIRYLFIRASAVNADIIRLTAEST